MLSDGRDDLNALVPVSVELETKDRQKRRWDCNQMLASPTRRLSREQHLMKFRRCWEFAAAPMSEDAREELIRVVDDLENITDVNILSRLLTGGSSFEERAKL